MRTAILLVLLPLTACAAPAATAVGGAERSAPLATAPAPPLPPRPPPTGPPGMVSARVATGTPPASPQPTRAYPPPPTPTGPTATPTPPGLVTPVPDSVPTRRATVTGLPPKEYVPLSPALRVVGPGVDTPAQRGSFWWQGANARGRGDLGDPRASLANAAPAAVPAGARLRLVFERVPNAGSVTATRWAGDRSEPVPVAPDGALVVGSDRGVFVYEVSAVWPDMGGSYAFKVEVT